jgi:hypothetical protein
MGGTGAPEGEEEGKSDGVNQVDGGLDGNHLGGPALLEDLRNQLCTVSSVLGVGLIDGGWRVNKPEERR